jgi:GMP synthase-like glutamine amidotransferase
LTDIRPHAGECRHAVPFLAGGAIPGQEFFCIGAGQGITNTDLPVVPDPYITPYKSSRSIPVDTMKIAVFQHTFGEPPGYFESYFTEKNIPFECIRLYETAAVPETDATHLIFLGGPMSVNDEREYPYLREEKALIRLAVTERKRVIGICLGAQLIASAFGARVHACEPETGWHPIRREPGQESVFVQFPDPFFAFQLHGETFEIPSGGRLLCSGKTVTNQAFLFGSALGLQFHLELTEGILSDWSRELKRSDQEKILRDSPLYLAESNRLCHLVAEDFTSH